MSEKREIKQRSIPLVYLWSFVTFGIYAIYWWISTKEDINSLGAKIPTTFLAFIPIVNFYWIYKYSEGYSLHVVKDNAVAKWFIINLFVGIITPALVQTELNKYASNEKTHSPNIAAA